MAAKSRSRSKKSPYRPGDVFTIPRFPDGYHVVVLVTSNHWGDAFGILDGFTRVEEIPTDARPAPAPNPVYAGLHEVFAGRWKHLGNSEELLRLFPSEPEIFHERNPSDKLFGPYGTAQSPSGKVREVSEEEAKSIRLGSLYLQVMATEQLESYLNTGNPFKGVHQLGQR